MQTQGSTALRHMTTEIEEHRWYLQHLACPDCRLALAFSVDGSRCSCGFSLAGELPLDLRPKHPALRTQTFALAPAIERDLERCKVERPPRVYDGPPAIRDSSELFSAVADRLTRGATLLDLGCGPRDQAVPAEHYGLRYVGVDYSARTADMLADGHAIPFRDATFDFILSYAVLEHLYNPFLAMSEISRVLKPDGIFFGTVSQGEPFHHSYFHHTAFGVVSVCGAAGFEVVRMWDSYDTLHGLSVMGRYPKPGKVMIEIVHRLLAAFPQLSPRKHFRWSSREKALDALHRAASICFVAIHRN
jgi:SAM-dependent methyltransferase